MIGRSTVALVVVAALSLGCTTNSPLPQITPVGGTASPSGTLPAGSTSQPVDSSSPSAPIAQMPACGLLFKTEVAAAVGVSVEHSQEMSANSDVLGWLSDCVFYRHAYFDQAPLDLTLAAGDRYVELFNELRTAPETSSRSGPGDEAFVRMSNIAGLDGPLGAMFVRIGSTVIGLSLGITDVTADGGLVLAGDSARQEQILADLAGLAIQRLTQPPVESTKTCALLSIEDVAGLTGFTEPEAIDVDEHDIWGPACQFKGSGVFTDLIVAVNTQPAASEHFATCQAAGETVFGTGDEAFLDRGQCVMRVGSFFISSPLMIRSGSTVIAVAISFDGALSEFSNVDGMSAIGQLMLQHLGLNPGTPLATADPTALSHPCDLVSDDDVSSIVGVTIGAHFGRGEAENAGQAMCIYSAAEISIQPLTLTIVHGEEAVSEFGNKTVYQPDLYTIVPGIGDAALTAQYQGETDQPLVTLYVRRGDAVLTLSMGPIRQSADFLSYVAPGTPAEQLEMLRQLAGIILPRLTGTD
jgi:hypothetical protein